MAEQSHQAASPASVAPNPVEGPRLPGGAHPPGSGPAAVIETHISVLFFVGDRVYKARKPVTTPFLDFSTRELRLADCQREIALNRRLAPDVYLGILDILDEQGRVRDHVVEMLRLPEQLRLASLVLDPACNPDHVLSVARRVAAFHAQAQRSAQIDTAGGIEHLQMLWTTNLAEISAFEGRFVSGELVSQLGRLALDYLAGRAPLFAQRVARGQIVDGHGDLLAQDIFCLPDGPRILDCIEFDERFRWGDVLYDTAFLAMDLEHLGRPELAARFLAAYREFAAEQHPKSLEHWYIGYRALVRAKIACLRAQQQGNDHDVGALLGIAERHLRACQVELVIVGGLPGSGKSTLAAGLGDALGWAVLRSDTVRGEIDGMGDSPLDGYPPDAGRYTPARREAVYREMLRRAEMLLRHGDSVILDATWLDPDARHRAGELASACSAGFRQLRCEVDMHALRRRIVARLAAGEDPSQATPAVLDHLAASAGLEWPDAVVIDTTRSPRQAVDQAMAALLP